MKDFSLKLFIAVLLLQSVPSLYDTFRIFLVSQTNTESFSILGHIEWFDLLHEIILTICVVPLYFLFNKYKNELSTIVRSVFVSFFFFYFFYSFLISLNLDNLLSFMKVTEQTSSVKLYLSLEMVALFFTFLNNILFIVLLIIGSVSVFYVLLFTKTIFILLSDFFLIPQFDFLGLAYSNIAVQFVLLVVAFIFINKKIKLLSSFKIQFFWFKDFFKVGGFSGGEIFLNNFMYGLVVMQMINMLNNQGDYWLANNFIWGLLLLPCFVLSEFIKRDALFVHSLKKYLYITLLIATSWIITMPFWGSFFKNVYKFDEQLAQNVSSIVFALIPYYFIFLFSNIFNSRFVGLGKTHFLFIVSLVVNCAYYPIALLLVKNNVFAVDMNFVVHLFGVGIVLNAILSVLLYFLFAKRKVKI